MEITKYPITYKYGQTITIKPIMDLHLGAGATDVRAFKQYLKDSDENTYFFGTGDLFDSIVYRDPRYSKSNDACKSNTSEIIDEQVEWGYELLKDYKKQLCGLGIGNHEMTAISRYGSNPIRRLCRRLDTNYLGYSGLLRLYFSEKGNTRGRSVIVRYHHGYGGGRTGGASITRYEKEMMNWDADLFCYGHDHQMHTKRYERLSLSGQNLIHKPKWLIVGGTFLKTFTIGDDPTYSERAGYSPTAIGGTKIEITPNRKWVRIKAYVDC